MKVLLSNDDGIDRPGLTALVRVFGDAGHEVWVAAPRRECSGSSSSLGTIREVARVDVVPRIPEVRGAARSLAIDGPPALAVRAVCTGAFGWVPDVVVAGVNPGFNTGRMVLHSGTVGAALTAASRDIPGIAVSTRDEEPRRLAAAARLALALADIVHQHDAGPVALNLNVPDGPVETLGGVAAADLSETSVADVSFAAGLDGLRIRRIDNDGPFTTGTDAALLQHGWAAITALRTPWAATPPAPEILGRLAEWWSEQRTTSPPTPSGPDRPGPATVRGDDGPVREPAAW